VEKEAKVQQENYDIDIGVDKSDKSEKSEISKDKTDKSEKSEKSKDKIDKSEKSKEKGEKNDNGLGSNNIGDVVEPLIIINPKGTSKKRKGSTSGSRRDVNISKHQNN